MVDSTGNVITDSNPHRATCPSYVFKCADSRKSRAFDLAKFALDYEDFFEGTTALLLASKTGNGFDIFHKCGATVFRAALNVRNEACEQPIDGFYSFIGDDNAALMFTEHWHSDVTFGLRAKYADAMTICETKPDYCTTDEWKSVSAMVGWLNGTKFKYVNFAHVNQLEHEGDREYYGDIIFSRFVKEVYSLTGKKAFFRDSTLRRFVDIDAEFAVVGDNNDMILLKKDIDGGESAEVTLICSMDEDAGFFDYEKYDKAD